MESPSRDLSSPGKVLSSSGKVVPLSAKFRRKESDLQESVAKALVLQTVNWRFRSRPTRDDHLMYLQRFTAMSTGVLWEKLSGLRCPR
jgi:hypothetical protein